MLKIRMVKEWPRLVILEFSLMKLALASLSSSLAANIPFARDFGINYVNCPEYFSSGAEWPLANQSGNVVKLCQNIYGKTHYYATLFNVDDRIPIYSGQWTINFCSVFIIEF